MSAAGEATIRSIVLINFSWTIPFTSGSDGSTLANKMSRLQIVDGLLNGPGWREHRSDTSGHDAAALATIHPSDEAHVAAQQPRRGGLRASGWYLPRTNRDRTMYHLIFTSHDTAGLASAKKELAERLKPDQAGTESRPPDPNGTNQATVPFHGCRGRTERPELDIERSCPRVWQLVFEATARPWTRRIRHGTLFLPSCAPKAT